MKKISSIQTFNEQLQKLSHLMEQQKQFNQKYIIQALQSVASSTSLPDSQGSISSEKCVRQQYNTINLYTEQEYCQQLLQQNLLCQSDTQALPFLIQTNLMRQPDKLNLCAQVQIDQQTTTKSIKYEPEDEQHIKQDEQFDNQDDTVILGYDRQKGKNKYNKNYKTHAIHGQNNYFDSAAATETIELSFDKQAIETQHFRREKTCTSKNETHTCKPSQSNINYNERQLNKSKDQVIKNKKQSRRPFTALKTTNKSNVNPKINKLDKEELNKLKEKGLAEEKILTARKNKTKREQAVTLNKNESTTTLETKNYSHAVSDSKPKIMKKKPIQQHSNAESAVNKINTNSKVWLKSTDKSVKKINRVHIGKIQETFKKDKPIPKYVSSVPHKSDKYESTYVQNYNRSILNSRFIHSSVKKLESKPNLMIKSKQQGDATPNHNRHIHVEPQINVNPSLNYDIPRDERIALVQKLDFDSKTPIMHRMIEAKNIFKFYNQMATGYVQAARKINTKELKGLITEIKTISDQAIIKMKIISAIIAFFSQFFKPTKKNVMGLIARYHEKQENLQLYSAWRDIEQDHLLKISYDPSSSSTSLDTLVLSLLQKPRDLVTKIQTLPSLLYNCNILSEHSVSSLLTFYQQINEKIDCEGDLELFLLKKTKIFNFLHRLVEFIRFLQSEGLIEKTERRNLNISKNMMIGYYSSRSRREERGKASTNVDKLKAKKGCDSQRKMTIDGIQTDRIYDIERKMKEFNADQNNKEMCKGRKETKPKSMQKQSKMSLSREHQLK